MTITDQEVETEPVLDIRITLDHSLAWYVPALWARLRKEFGPAVPPDTDVLGSSIEILVTDYPYNDCCQWTVTSATMTNSLDAHVLNGEAQVESIIEEVLPAPVKQAGQ